MSGVVDPTCSLCDVEADAQMRSVSAEISQMYALHVRSEEYASTICCWTNIFAHFNRWGI